MPQRIERPTCRSPVPEPNLTHRHVNVGCEERLQPHRRLPDSECAVQRDTNKWSAMVYLVGIQQNSLGVIRVLTNCRRQFPEASGEIGFALRGENELLQRREPVSL